MFNLFKRKFELVKHNGRYGVRCKRFLTPTTYVDLASYGETWHLNRKTAKWCLSVNRIDAEKRFQECVKYGTVNDIKVLERG